MQCSGGEKAAGRFSGRGGRERIDELGDLGLVGIADDPGDTGEGGEFFGGALGVAAGDDYPRGMILRADFPDGVPGLGVSSGGNSAGVYHHDVGCAFVRRRVATLQQLHLKRDTIGLRGATSKLLNVKSWHDSNFTSHQSLGCYQGRKANGSRHTLFVDALRGGSFRVAAGMLLLPVPRG